MERVSRINSGNRPRGGGCGCGRRIGGGRPGGQRGGRPAAARQAGGLRVAAFEANSTIGLKNATDGSRQEGAGDE
jgi:hypothetical protein